MNRPIRRLAVAFMVLFFALLANANYIQVFQAPDYNDNTDNTRVLLDEYARQRGPILVGQPPDQIEVARSVETTDDLVYLRKYAKPALYGHITGYYSYTLGPNAIESAYNSILAGTDDGFFVRRVVDLVTNRQPKGGSVKLSIDPRAQQAAFDGLEGKTGSVVAIEPATGKILAMVSRPGYDPNRLSSHDAGKISDAWAELNDDQTDPLENRATQRRYPPGSTFKLVTSAAALSSGSYTPETNVPAPAELDLPQTTKNMTNWQDGLCDSGDEISLQRALETSCNTAYADLALKLGDEALREQAEKFGFGAAHLSDLRGVSSVFPEEVDKPQTALSAIGQYDVAATPLQMAMVTAGIANGGTVMKPYVVSELSGPDLNSLDETDPEVLSEAVSPQVAEQLKQMMVGVVENGTGSPVKMGVPVAGKTGTAQTTPDRPPFAWFVSFAPADNPSVAVAVVIEKADVGRSEISGGRLAAPIAKDVMEAVIE
ncbi:penicillin-binding transpeptidase domain-containing protein [Actinopolymorpha sp. B17G11]|uniref:peptidoglycan D,D-transpeptidase FtsI family protein n=1 Tax=unclassified Actinopolymorpha TaxID=2627063 RepID=UPI0032D98E85